MGPGIAGNFKKKLAIYGNLPVKVRATTFRILRPLRCQVEDPVPKTPLGGGFRENNNR